MDYQYNAVDQLISREEGYYASGNPTISHTEHFTYDGDSIALTFNEDSLPVRRYVWNPVTGDLLTDERASWVTGEFYGIYWAANDHLGSVRELLDEQATIAEHREYDSFGGIDAVFSSLGGSRPVANMFSDVAHAGRMWDDDADLYYNNARWYDPATGRFVNEDPVLLKNSIRSGFGKLGNQLRQGGGEAGSITKTDKHRQTRRRQRSFQSSAEYLEGASVVGPKQSL